MNRTWKAGIGIAVGAALMALAGCSGGDSADTSASTTLTINGAQPISFDPSQGQEGSWLPTFQAAYDTLILRKPNGELTPMLATKWTYDSQRTGLTLKLRSGVKFSDGTTFDASAAKANLDHFRTGTGPQGGTLADIKSVKILDSSSILINLKQPSPSVLDALANAGGLMGSPKALGTKAIKSDPVGTGPYTLDTASTVTGSKYVFVKKKDYWKPQLQHYNKIIIKVIADPTAALNALLSGQLDAALLNTKTAAQARADSKLAEYKYANNWLGLIFYDRAGKAVPALKDVRVRQAINYAIDSKSIVSSVYDDQGELTSQIFGPDSTGYVKDLDSAYTFDPKRARTLMKEAGYAKGFTITLPVAASLDPAMIAAVVQELDDIGITVKTKAADPANLIGDLTSPKYAVIPMTLFQPSTWETLTTSVTPDALFNAGKSTDPKVKSMLQTIRVGSAEESEKAAKELNQYLVSEAWFAPIFRPSQFFFASKTIAVTPQAQQLLPSIYNYQPAR